MSRSATHLIEHNHARQETCHQPSTAAPCCYELYAAPSKLRDLTQVDLRQIGIVLSDAEVSRGILEVLETIDACRSTAISMMARDTFSDFIWLKYPVFNAWIDALGVKQNSASRLMYSLRERGGNGTFVPVANWTLGSECGVLLRLGRDSDCFYYNETQPCEIRTSLVHVNESMTSQAFLVRSSQGCQQNSTCSTQPFQQHGDDHPLVTIAFGTDPLVSTRAGEMTLRFHLVGAVVGFRYRIVVQEVSIRTAQVNQQVVSVLSVEDDSSASNEAAVELVVFGGQEDNFKFAIAVFDAHEGLTDEEALVARRDGSFPVTWIGEPWQSKRGASTTVRRRQNMFGSANLEDHQDLYKFVNADFNSRRNDEDHVKYECLFFQTHEHLQNMQKYHRLQLKRHFLYMSELGVDAKRVPVLRWFNRAFNFYDDYINQTMSPNLVFGADTFPEIPRVQWSRRNFNWRFVLEDLHPGGRGLAGDQAHEAIEIVLSTQYKLAYVVVRKCASTAIQKYFNEFLGGNVAWCNFKHCKSFSERCTSLCLDPEVHLDDFLFFSFVQHPVRRFFKSLTTLLPRKILSSGRAHQVALKLLSVLQETSHTAEHHLETQCFALSSPTMHVGYPKGSRRVSIVTQGDAEYFDQILPQIQMDFIGRLENVDDDWKRLINLANNRTGVPKIDYRPLMVVRREQKVNESEKLGLWTRIMTPEVISLAHETYAQDVVSLGYGWLDGSSYCPIEAEILAPTLNIQTSQASAATQDQAKKSRVDPTQAQQDASGHGLDDCMGFVGAQLDLCKERNFWRERALNAEGRYHLLQSESRSPDSPVATTLHVEPKPSEREPEPDHPPLLINFGDTPLVSTHASKMTLRFHLMDAVVAFRYSIVVLEINVLTGIVNQQNKFVHYVNDESFASSEITADLDVYDGLQDEFKFVIAAFDAKGQLLARKDGSFPLVVTVLPSHEDQAPRRRSKILFFLHIREHLAPFQICITLHKAAFQSPS